jgi:hypothetical protein
MRMKATQITVDAVPYLLFWGIRLFRHHQMRDIFMLNQLCKSPRLRRRPEHHRRFMNAERLSQSRLLD